MSTTKIEKFLNHIFNKVFFSWKFLSKDRRHDLKIIGHAKTNGYLSVGGKEKSRGKNNYCHGAWNLMELVVLFCL